MFALLDQASVRPVTWVHGPAGSGKTTLAASWLARRGGRNLWYQLDARDRDAATFFHYLREAVRKVAPRRRELAPLTPEHLPDLDTYARNFFDAVFERLGAPAVLVLDDFQEIPEDAALPGILAAIPEGAHVLVLSRAGPPPALARLRDGGLVATLGWEALRFTPQEAAGLLAEHGLPTAGSAAPADLYEMADGWAAGLVLLGEAARRGERRAPAAERRPPAELFDYFASQLCDRCDPAIKRVLLATAPLATVSAAVAERLAGEGAGAVLERLARDNFFTTRRAGAEPVFQYHPLFRAFLRARMETALAVEERTALQRRAAGLLDEAGHPEEALALLQAIGDGEAAGALVVRLAPTLHAQGRLRTLEAWIRGLPEPVREADPWLLYWLGACRAHADPRESLALTERAFASFQALGDDAGCLAAWIGAMTAIRIVDWDPSSAGWGATGTAAPWLRWLEARMRRAPGFPSPAVAANVAGMLVTRLLMGEPSHPDLPTWAARLAAAVEALEDPDARVRALHPLVWYRAWTGDLAALASDADALEQACRASGVPTATRIVGLGVVAIAASYGTCDRERTLSCATEALRLGAGEGIHVYDTWLHGTAAHVHQGRGDPAGAAPHVDAIRKAFGARAGTDARYLRAAAGQALCVGDLDGALAAAEGAARALDRAGVALLRPAAELELAQVHRARGELAAAERHLAVAEGAALASNAAPFVWACRLMRAQLALQRGARDAGRRLLAEALAEGRSRGFTSVPLSSTALALAGACEEALEAGIELDYVRRLIRLHDLAPDPARPGAERWPFALRITALGRFAVHGVDGRALAHGSTRSRPFELLRILVALGGREVAAPRLVELLWPEADRDIGRQRLRYTLHGLRRRLGQDAVHFDGGVMSLDARRVWVDVWALDRRLARLAAAVERGREEDAREALVGVLGLHCRPLLEDDEAPWAAGARERLQSRIRGLVLRAIALEGVATASAMPALHRVADQFPRDAELQQALARARAQVAAPAAS